MVDAVANFAYSTVATAPSPATSGTSLVVGTGEGARFPATPFNAVIWPTGTQALSSNAEIVRVSLVSTDTLTIARAQEGSSARTIVVGDQIMVGPTAKTITDLTLVGRATSTPRSGWNAMAEGWFTTATGTPVVGTCYFAPFRVGPQGWTTDQAQIAVTGAITGGATVAVTVGLYGDDGTGWPDVVTGPLVTGTFSTFTTGNKTAAWGSSLALLPGYYWIAVLYTFGTVPTIAPIFSTYTNTSWALPQATGLGFTQTRGYKTVATNLTVLPSGTALTSSTMTITGSTDNPVVGIHRA